MGRGGESRPAPIPGAVPSRLAIAPRRPALPPSARQASDQLRAEHPSSQPSRRETQGGRALSCAQLARGAPLDRIRRELASKRLVSLGWELPKERASLSEGGDPEARNRFPGGRTGEVKSVNLGKIPTKLSESPGVTLPAPAPPPSSDSRL